MVKPGITLRLGRSIVSSNLAAPTINLSNPLWPHRTVHHMPYVSDKRTKMQSNLDDARRLLEVLSRKHSASTVEVYTDANNADDAGLAVLTWTGEDTLTRKLTIQVNAKNRQVIVQGAVELHNVNAADTSDMPNMDPVVTVGDSVTQKTIYTNEVNATLDSPNLMGTLELVEALVLSLNSTDMQTDSGD